jgi:hypothetical protein
LSGYTHEHFRKTGEFKALTHQVPEHDRFENIEFSIEWHGPSIAEKF